MFIEAKDDGGGGDNWTTGAISRAKLQSNHHHQRTNIQFFYRPDALPVNQPTVSKDWREKYHITWTCLPQAHLGVSQLCLWPLIAPVYLEGGLPCLSSALWCQYPTDCLILKSFGSKYGFPQISWHKDAYRSLATTKWADVWCVSSMITIWVIYNLSGSVCS